jgi:quinohemoprotein amine dehydrogenase
MVKLKTLLASLLAAVSTAGLFAADVSSNADKEKEKQKEIDQGIPITSELVRNTCSPCHKADDKLRLTRISYRRTTPEGWEQTIKRMIDLNGLQVQPEQARLILKYLATNLGLAPEESKPAAWEVEKRLDDFKYTADKDTEATCTKCHSFGRVMLQRRTKTDWEYLVAMHRGYYPLSDFQAFRRMGPLLTQPGPDGRPPDNRQPMEKAIAHLSTAFPLVTPEWSAWSANMREPKLAGKWAFAAYQPGKGPVYGTVTIHGGAAGDEFVTECDAVYARSGQAFKRSGKSIVYTGYQWRGRSKAGDQDKDGMREVMFIDRDMHQMTGRWFTGAYEEIGMDVKLERIGNDPVVLGLDRMALKKSATTAVAIHGINLAANVTADAIDLGRGVKVTRVVSSTPTMVKAEVEVAADAPIGKRDVFVAGASLPAGAVVYDKVDAIKVRPQAGMARIGGIQFPKQYAQFEAIAYSNGPDGKPGTKDDIEIGPVDVAWSMDEYASTYGDDDKQYVGKLDDNGFFTPNVDGPNPERHNHTNNYGDVWIVAAYRAPDGGKDAAPLRGRAHLLVTVPLYIRFDQPEVAP